MKRLIITNGLSGTERKYVQQDDSIADSRESAKRFATILEADTHAMWLSFVFGIELYAILASQQ